MSRPIRLEYPGAVFHITCRGNERRTTFRDDLDRVRFLDLLGQAVDRFRWVVTAYVLMSNHFHFVVELTAANLSRGMQWLNGGYVQRFNLRHERVGHLHQGRFKSILIEEDTYMLELIRYVVLNPVRANMVPRPEDYAWSSYRATAGLGHVPEWLAADDVLLRFGSDRDLAQARYRRFVEDGIGSHRVPWEDLVGQVYLGSEQWRNEVRDRLRGRPRADAHPRQQRALGERTMAEVMTSVARALPIDPAWLRLGRGGTARMIAAWIGRHEADLNLAEIAAALRLRSSGHVSMLIQRCDERLDDDVSLRSSVDRCVEALHDLWKSDEAKL